MQKKIYFISGLGADESAFMALELPGIEPVFLNWMEPLKGEHIQQYAARMTKRITEPNPIIVGLSFGGMMAIEIAKLIPVQQLILISSAKTRKELPLYFRICRFVPLHRILPLQSIALNTRLMSFFFGARNQLQQEKLKAIIQNSIHGFNKWAVNEVVNWKNQSIQAPLFHIHGNADNLLPHRYVQADVLIEGGDHFMVVHKANEISEYILKLLTTESKQ